MPMRATIDSLRIKKKKILNFLLLDASRTWLGFYNFIVRDVTGAELLYRVGKTSMMHGSR